jgi:DHA2 family multidrug resistance protein-like MFS transporter
VGTGSVAPLVAAAMALIAGICSLARLRPSIRNPERTETEESQPAQVR